MLKTSKRILDVACGSRMFYFDKDNPDVVFMDNRECDELLCDGRKLQVHPDIIGDFRNIPFESDTFDMVVFDPPHLVSAGETSWLAKKYGRLNPNTYLDDLKTGFLECFRVLKPNGTLVFKWNETDIPTSEIVKLAPQKPVFGNRNGKRSQTQWLVFIK